MTEDKIPYSFDLITQPWIPCLERSGRPVELSLQDALARAHELVEISGESPLVTASLYRLLLAILTRVYCPQSMAAWDRLWRAGRWDPAPLQAYWQTWGHRFDLFHPERPFYQMADGRVQPKSIISLLFDMASGNNATLFDHHTENTGAALSPAQAARAVVAIQSFGLGGLSGIKGVAFTDAPCARGICFLACGDTLFETLALNLPAYTADAPMQNTPADLPAWEMNDPFLPARETPLGTLDYLTWQSRRILLAPEMDKGQLLARQITLAPGLRLGEGVFNPMKHYLIDEKRGPREVRFTEGKSLWRDSASFLRWKDLQNSKPAYCIHWLGSLVWDAYLEPSHTYRLQALGMANDQAKVEFFRSERMPLPLEYLKRDELVSYLRQATEMSEAVSRQIYGSLVKLAGLLFSPESDSEGRQPAKEDINRLISHWGAERNYWAGLELPFLRLVEALPQDPLSAMTAWQTILRSAAWRTFDTVESLVGLSPRVYKALVQARGQLAAGLAKALPEIKTSEVSHA